LSAELMFT